MKKLHAFAALALTLTLLLASCGTPAADTAPTPVDSAAPTETTPAADTPAETAGPTLGEKDPNVNYTLRVGQTGTSIKASMVVLAHEMGYYEEEGLEVTLEPIGNLNDGLTAILGGSLDILPMGIIPTCTFVAQGADLTVIGGTISEGSECVILPDRAAEFEDLTWFAGKTVACVRPETGHMIMKAKIREAGVDMSTVDFVELDGFQSVVEAVLKGEADVGFVNSGFGQNARAQGLEVLFPVGEYAPNAVCCRQTALGANVEANRDAYVRFEIANLRAMKLMLEDEDTTVQVLSDYSGQDHDYVWNCIYDGVMKISMDPARERVEDFYQVMKDNGDIDASAPDVMGDHVDPSIYYDALTAVMERYPDFAPYAEMMDAYAVNNP